MGLFLSASALRLRDVRNRFDPVDSSRLKLKKGDVLTNVCPIVSVQL